MSLSCTNPQQLTTQPPRLGTKHASRRRRAAALTEVLTWRYVNCHDATKHCPLAKSAMNVSLQDMRSALEAVASSSAADSVAPGTTTRSLAIGSTPPGQGQGLTLMPMTRRLWSDIISDTGSDPDMMSDTVSTHQRPQTPPPPALPGPLVPGAASATASRPRATASRPPDALTSQGPLERKNVFTGEPWTSQPLPSSLAATTSPRRQAAAASSPYVFPDGAPPAAPLAEAIRMPSPSAGAASASGGATQQPEPWKSKSLPATAWAMAGKGVGWRPVGTQPAAAGTAAPSSPPVRSLLQPTATTDRGAGQPGGGTNLVDKAMMQDPAGEQEAIENQATNSGAEALGNAVAKDGGELADAARAFAGVGPLLQLLAELLTKRSDDLKETQLRDCLEAVRSLSAVGKSAGLASEADQRLQDLSCGLQRSLTIVEMVAEAKSTMEKYRIIMPVQVRSTNSRL